MIKKPCNPGLDITYKGYDIQLSDFCLQFFVQVPELDINHDLFHVKFWPFRIKPGILEPQFNVKGIPVAL